MKEERKRRALGKGLSSLIPDEPVEGALAAERSAAPLERGEAGRALEVAVSRIAPNPHQPRVHFDEAELEALTDSVRASGILQPLLVRAEPDGGFTLIAGERRLRAAKRAGLERVPVVVRAISDARLLEAALVENIQRDDLNPLETARAFRALIREFGLTQAEAATRVGKPRSTVANFLRLLDLPREVQGLLDKGRLEMGHGRALAGLVEAEAQTRIATRAAEEGWSVRRVEDEVRREQERSLGVSRPSASRKEEERKDPNVAAAEQTLSRSLGARAKIQQTRSGKGRIEIVFSDEEDLDRLYRLLLRASGA